MGMLGVRRVIRKAHDLHANHQKLVEKGRPCLATKHISTTQLQAIRPCSREKKMKRPAKTTLLGIVKRAHMREGANIAAGGGRGGRVGVPGGWGGESFWHQPLAS